GLGDPRLGRQWCGVGTGNDTFCDCRDCLALTRRKVPFPKHYYRSSPMGPPASATLSVSCAKMAYGHTSAALSQSFITPRPAATLFETVASFLEFFRPRTGLMQGLRGLCAIGRLLIPLHVQGDTLANVFSRPH